MIQSVNHRPRARTIAPRREAFLTLLKMKKREKFCFETLKSFGVNVADEHFGPCANQRDFHNLFPISIHTVLNRARAAHNFGSTG